MYHWKIGIRLGHSSLFTQLTMLTESHEFISSGMEFLKSSSVIQVLVCVTEASTIWDLKRELEFLDFFVRNIEYSKLRGSLIQYEKILGVLRRSGGLKWS